MARTALIIAIAGMACYLGHSTFPDEIYADEATRADKRPLMLAEAGASRGTPAAADDKPAIAEPAAGRQRSFDELLGAAASGEADEVVRLLAQGASINAKNAEGYGALAVAAAQGHSDVVKILIDKGAFVNAKNKEGVSPLSLACAMGHADVVKILLEKGAEIEVRDNAGWTPVGMTAMQGHASVLKLLIDRGANVNTKNEVGVSPLWVAAFQGHKDVAKMLLDAGAEVNERNKEGVSPLSAAKAHGRSEVMKLLKAGGGKEFGPVSASQGRGDSGSGEPVRRTRSSARSRDKSDTVPEGGEIAERGEEGGTESSPRRRSGWK